VRFSITLEFGKNLFSVSYAVKEGIDIQFNAKEKVCYLTHASVHVAKAVVCDTLQVHVGVRFVEHGHKKEEEGGLGASAFTLNEGSLHLWHHQLGHLGEENLLRLAKHNMVRSILYL
jgi:hypothetical protein